MEPRLHSKIFHAVGTLVTRWAQRVMAR